MSEEVFTVKRNRLVEKRDYNVLVSDFEDANVEQRRLKSTNKIISLQITTPPLLESEKDDVVDFFDARNGKYDDFLYTNPIDDVQYRVRFARELSTNYAAAHWIISIELKVLEVA